MAKVLLKALRVQTLLLPQVDAPLKPPTAYCCECQLKLVTGFYTRSLRFRFQVNDFYLQTEVRKVVR